jgi:anti-sigma regulatory factor (Ser/Thr protein kinase)
MNSAVMTLDLEATPEEVMRAVEALQDFGRGHGIPDKHLFGPLLALEECGSNIVDYALSRDSQRKFQVMIEYDNGALTIVLRDNGPEFDPTRFRKPQSTDDMPAGGWGLKLVRRSMDELRYIRENGENILSLKKIVSSEQQDSTTTSKR